MNTSLWAATATRSTFPALASDTIADVAIVGGGITGITTALLLAESGRSVVVLEAHGVGTNTTGCSTGNLYAMVGDGLAGIEKKWGEAAMREVAHARRSAVDFIESCVARHGIDCAFERVPFHWVALGEGYDPRDRLEAEHAACEKAGLAARIVPSLKLPFATGPALVVDDQAQFHPLRYVRELAKRVASERLRIFEQTPALDVDAAGGVVRTARGVVRARDVVMATHTPKGFNLVQTELGPYREYAVAAEVRPGTFPPGVFWTLEEAKHSIRRFQDGGREYVMVLGEKHKTGQEKDPEARYRALEEYLQRHVPGGKPSHRWSAQGYYPADGLPYIGHAPGSEHLFIATGFAADGLTWGTAAARLVADEIAGRGEESALLRATRFAAAKGARGLLRENIDVATEYVKDYLRLPAAAPVGDLAPGDGRIAEVDGKRCAVHRTASGELLAVSPICTHLKCVVHWNRAEQSWDCPCHGSRFAPDGTVLEGPALAPLERIPIAR